MHFQCIGTWPTGTYGFAAPKSGCPENFKTGYRYHDLEDTNPNNQWSSGIHLDSK